MGGDRIKVEPALATRGCGRCCMALCCREERGYCTQLERSSVRGRCRGRHTPHRLRAREGRGALRARRTGGWEGQAEGQRSLTGLIKPEQSGSWLTECGESSLRSKRTRGALVPAAHMAAQSILSACRGAIIIAEERPWSYSSVLPWRRRGDDTMYKCRHLKGEGMPLNH